MKDPNYKPQKLTPHQRRVKRREYIAGIKKAREEARIARHKKRQPVHEPPEAQPVP